MPLLRFARSLLLASVSCPGSGRLPLFCSPSEAAMFSSDWDTASFASPTGDVASGAVGGLLEAVVTIVGTSVIR